MISKEANRLREWVSTALPLPRPNQGDDRCTDMWRQLAPAPQQFDLRADEARLGVSHEVVEPRHY